MENKFAPALAALVLRSGLSFWMERNPQASPFHPLFSFPFSVENSDARIFGHSPKFVTSRQ